MDWSFYRRYQVFEEVGSGGFGTVKRAIDLESKLEVAIKFEEKRMAKRLVLQTETEAIRHLQGGPGIPKLYASGHTDSFAYMVEELLGPNLSKLYKGKNGKASHSIAGKSGVQMLTTMEFVHKHGYIHRDIKPQNFCAGLHDSETVFLMDFGLAKKYIDTQVGVHAPYREGRAFVGTASYASLNCHLGIRQSRRDDLESLLLVLLYLIKGKLPWQTLKYKGKTDKQIQIRMQKILIPVEELCAAVPLAFLESFKYVRSLTYEEKPDYGRLRRDLGSLSRTDACIFDIPSGDDRLKRSYKMHKKNSMKHSITFTTSAERIPKHAKARGPSRIISCPPMKQGQTEQDGSPPGRKDTGGKLEESEVISAVFGHKTRSSSVGILPEQPSSSQPSSESSYNAWIENGDLSSTLKGVPVHPINRRILMNR